jgi:hypothetical protein
MVQNKRFCTKCGSPVSPDDQYCGSCGNKISSTPSVSSVMTPSAAPESTPKVSQVPSESHGEQLLGIIPSVSRKKGLFNFETFNIVVTDKRMVFALMTNDMIKEAAKQAGKDGGFFNSLANAMTIGYTYYKKYSDVPPDTVLNETPGNFSIDLNKIKKMRLSEGRRIRGQDHREYYENSRLDFETPGAKYSLSLPRNFHDAASDILHKTGLY